MGAYFKINTLFANNSNCLIEYKYIYIYIYFNSSHSLLVLSDYVSLCLVFPCASLCFRAHIWFSCPSFVN